MSKGQKHQTYTGKSRSNRRWWQEKLCMVLYKLVEGKGNFPSYGLFPWTYSRHLLGPGQVVQHLQHTNLHSR